MSVCVCVAVPRSHRTVLGDLFQPILEAVHEAPLDSPLRDANLNQIADFLLHLCGPREPNVRVGGEGRRGPC